MPHKFLVIQTAFIGDVILATPVVEKLHRHYPDAAIDVLVRKGNESIFRQHPFVQEVLVWDKKRKYRDLWRLLRVVRGKQYDAVINLQRFGAMGFLTGFSAAAQRIGFQKNPFAWRFTHRLPHRFGSSEKPLHEVERNLSLIAHLTDNHFEPPRLYPTPDDYAKVAETQPYICFAPASVWETKRLPTEKWVALLHALPRHYRVYLLGAPSDHALCQTILQQSQNPQCINVSGKFDLLQSAALMQGAVMNYVNDSAPLHLASAVNAPVAAAFCSTVPAFGFTPLSSVHYVLENPDTLPCRPCGLHGKKNCPLGHFRCGDIPLATLLQPLNRV